MSLPVDFALATMPAEVCSHTTCCTRSADNTAGTLLGDMPRLGVAWAPSYMVGAWAKIIAAIHVCLLDGLRHANPCALACVCRVLLYAICAIKLVQHISET
jgi:hypothetical protein